MKTKNAAVIPPLFLIIIIDMLGIGLVFPIFAPLIVQAHSSLLPAHTTHLVRDIIYGLSLGLFPLCMFFGAPILGDLSHALGRKKRS